MEIEAAEAYDEEAVSLGFLKEALNFPILERMKL